MGEQANSLDYFLFLQGHNATRPLPAGLQPASHAGGNGNAGDAAEGRAAAGTRGIAIARALRGGD